MKSRSLFASVMIGCMATHGSLAGEIPPPSIDDTGIVDDVEIGFDPALASPGAVGPVFIKHDREEIPPADPKLVVEPDGTKFVEIYGQKRPLSEIGFDVDGDHISEMVRDRMDKTDVSDTINVYVRIGVPLTDEVIGKIQSAVGKSVAVHPMTYYGLNHVAVELTPPQLVLLAKLPFVQFVEPAWAGYQKGMMNAAREHTGVNYSHGNNTFCSGWLNSTNCAINGDHDGNRWGFSTQDVVVAVMDSGIDRNHEAFNGGAKIIGWTDQTGAGEASAVDPWGHGTHVASIIAGESGVGYYGVVPGAALVGVRVFDANGRSTTWPDGETSVTKGLRWLIDNRAAFNIRVVNYSGGNIGCHPSTGFLNQTLINQLIDAGITFVSGAGNSESDINNGQPRYCHLNYVAAVPRVIGVGNIADPSTNENGLGWTLRATSSWGPTSDGITKPDVMAPGTCIMAAKATGTLLPYPVRCTYLESSLPAGYVDYSGTSMSTPFVAGIAAGLLDANPNLTPAQIKSHIVDNAETASGVNNNVYGKGYVRAFNTYKAVLGGSDTWDDGYDHAVQAYFSISQGTVVTHNFDRSDNSKHIHVTLAAPKYGTNPGGESNVAFRVRLVNPDGSLYGDTGNTAQPIKHLYRESGGQVGTWQIKVTAITVPNGGYASYLLDVTEK